MNLCRFRTDGVQWTNSGLSDLARLYEFLGAVNKRAAARTAQSLAKAPTRLLVNQRLGGGTIVRILAARGAANHRGAI